MTNLAGKTVLVTGAASGIGRSLSLQFAGRGSDLILVDINLKGLKEVSDKVEGIGSRPTVHVLDISNPEHIEALAPALEPDVLVNCAGVAILSDIENTTRSEWEHVLGVNLYGPINMVTALLPHLKRVGGHIVNIASGAGLCYIPYVATYVTSKFGLVGYTETLGAEMAPLGVRVTLVCPGFTDTPIFDVSPRKGFDWMKLDRALTYFRPFFCVTPDQLAAAVIRAIEKDKPILIHTIHNRLFYNFRRFLPGLYRWIARGFYRVARYYRSREV